MNGRICHMSVRTKAVIQTQQFVQSGAGVCQWGRGGRGRKCKTFTISRSSRAVSRASSSRDASCAFARASFISSESGLPSIASMIPGSRSVLRVGGDAATSLPVLLVEVFSMLQRRRLCMLRSGFRGGKNTVRERERERGGSIRHSTMISPTLIGCTAPQHFVSYQ